MLWVCKPPELQSRSRDVLACVALILLLALSGCRRNSESELQVEEDSATSQSADETSDVSAEYPVVRIETSEGTFNVELNAVEAPLTVRNFLNYVNDGFYSNSLIHYVDPDAMILGGGYSANGQRKQPGPPIRNEAHNGLNNVRGTIAMTRDIAAGIDSATSQFFINLVDTPSFDHRGETSEDYGYCVFGKVIDGMDVVEEISRSSTRDGGGDLAQTPDPPVIVESVKVIR